MERLNITDWNTEEAWKIAAAREDRARRTAAGERRVWELNSLHNALAATALNPIAEPVIIPGKLPETATAGFERTKLDKVA